MKERVLVGLVFVISFIVVVSGQTCIPGSSGCEECVGFGCGSCSDFCSPSGSTQCIPGGGYQECGDWDSDTCLEWSEGLLCPIANQICSGGSCGPSCSDECSPSDSTQCVDSSNYQTCGDYDADSCLEWSSSVSCNAGEVCSGGVCIEDCSDECSPSDSTQCVDSSNYQTCGNWDADSCLEWSSSVSCNAGEVCSGGSCVLDINISYVVWEDLAGVNVNFTNLNGLVTLKAYGSNLQGELLNFTIKKTRNFIWN